MPKNITLEQRNAQRKRYYTKHREDCTRSGRRWKPSEDSLVLKHLMPDVKLKNILKRSVEAIQLHRSFLLKKAKTI